MAGRRILMTADAVGGVWQYACDLSRELAALGHQVTIACMGPAPSEDQRWDVAAGGQVGLVPTGLPLDWLCDGPAPMEAAARHLARMAGEQAFDLVHCNMPSLAAAADWPAPLVAVAHGCVATWWEAARDRPLDEQFAWHREMTRKGLESANRLVAPTAAYADTIVRHYGLHRRPQVVLNGRRPLTECRHAARGSPHVLTVGRLWDSVKGAELLDQVAANLTVPFLAAGAARGPHGEQVTLHHLQLRGELATGDLAALLLARPIFVSAASFEPFGLAALEAAGAGCPLVLSDIPTFRELWDGAAIFVPPGDAPGFEAVIRALLADVDLCRSQGAAAAERAARYTPAATACGMAAIYDDVLRRERVAA